MQEGDQYENCLEVEGLDSKFREDDVLWYFLLAPDDMLKKEDLDSFSQCPI